MGVHDGKCVDPECPLLAEPTIDGVPQVPHPFMEVRERLAAYAHEAWSGWMGYLFSKGAYNHDGTFIIPQSLVERWTRQLQTEYAELPEAEKESDRKEADRMLDIVMKEGWDGPLDGTFQEEDEGVDVRDPV